MKAAWIVFILVHFLFFCQCSSESVSSNFALLEDVSTDTDELEILPEIVGFSYYEENRHSFGHFEVIVPIVEEHAVSDSSGLESSTDQDQNDNKYFYLLQLSKEELIAKILTLEGVCSINRREIDASIEMSRCSHDNAELANSDLSRCQEQLLNTTTSLKALGVVMESVQSEAAKVNHLPESYEHKKTLSDSKVELISAASLSSCAAMHDPHFLREICQSRVSDAMLTDQEDDYAAVGSSNRYRCNISNCWEALLLAAQSWMNGAHVVANVTRSDAARSDAVDVEDEPALLALSAREVVRSLKAQLIWSSQVLSRAGLVSAVGLIKRFVVLELRVIYFVGSSLSTEWRESVMPLVREHVGPIWAAVLLRYNNSPLASSVGSVYLLLLSEWYARYCETLVLNTALPVLRATMTALRSFANAVFRFLGDDAGSPAVWTQCVQLVSSATQSVVAYLVAVPLLQEMAGGNDFEATVSQVVHWIFAVAALALVYCLRRVMVGLVAAGLVLVLSPLLFSVFVLAKLLGYVLPRKKRAKVKRSRGTKTGTTQRGHD